MNPQFVIPPEIRVVSRRETRHGLHLLLTFATCGFWAITGWPVAWLWNRFGPAR